MAGLFSGTPQGQPAGMQQQAIQQQGLGVQAAGEEAQPNVSPEEQQQYEQFVGNAMTLIYDEDRTPRMLAGLKGAGNPAEGLASTAVTVVKGLADSAEQNGVQISPDVMMHGGLEIIEELADLQREAGIADLTPEEIEGAFYRALDLYRESATAEGKLDTAALEQDFAVMQQADQQGRLGEVLPGADQAAQRFAGATQRLGGSNVG